MSHGYQRQPSSKGGGRMPPEDGWNQSGHSQGHRGAPYAGGGGPGGPPGAAGMPAGRLVEMLDLVKQEFEGVLHDNSALKSQREEFEAKGVYPSPLPLSNIATKRKMCSLIVPRYSAVIL